MNASDLIRRVDELIEMGNGILAAHKGDGIEGSVVSDVIRGFRQKSATLIAEVRGCSPAFPDESESPPQSAVLKNAELEMAALRAIREEIRYAGVFGH